MAAPHEPRNGDSLEKTQRLEFAIQYIREGRTFLGLKQALADKFGICYRTANKDAREAVDLYRAALAEYARDHAPEAVASYTAKEEIAMDLARAVELEPELRIKALSVATKARDSRSRIEGLFVERTQEVPAPTSGGIDLSKLSPEKFDELGKILAEATTDEAAAGPDPGVSD